MKKYRSIQQKLTTSIMLLISLIFIVLLSIIVASEIQRITREINHSKFEIKNNLIENGKTTVKNNSFATSRVLAKERQLFAIQELLTATLLNDKDILYILYMDANRLPLIHSTREYPRGVPDFQAYLEDSISMWASTQASVAYKEYNSKLGDIVEFTAPVFMYDQRIGHIRIGVSTQSMNTAIASVISSGKSATYQMTAIILLLGVLSISVGFLIIKRIAARITRPIDSLVKSTHLIAQGNYNVTINQESNDEIGRLAVDFQSMQETIRNYTDHLQEIIDQKMLQVTDILNNIDQGLFTINLDGTVNPEYSSRANQILKIKDISLASLQDILRMDIKQNAMFMTWLELVKKMHKQMRWAKLARLAPVQELELPSDETMQDISFVSISYQCIFDTDKNLSKIMVLALDITEKRLKDLHMASERQRHENDVKAILSIANSTAEEIAEFMEDTTVRLDELVAQSTKHMDGVIKQREEFPDGPEYIITNESIDNMYRDLHTIKGNSGSYGFDLLATIAHQAEDQLEKLRQPITVRRSEDLRALEEYLFKMKAALDDIHQKIQMIFGEDEEMTIRIPEYHIATILKKCEALDGEQINHKTHELIDECKMLAWKSLRILLRKYQKNALAIARKLHKNVEVVIKNEKQFFNPVIVSGIDEILLHLVRNAVDHGIESPEIRDELGKGTGKIYIELDVIDEYCFLVVSDDGRGIDIEKLLTNAIAKKLITPEQAVSMTNDDKIALLYKGGLTTAIEVTEVSGRGMGMDIVQHRIKDLEGTITTSTVFGQGTTFCIKIPVHSLIE